MLEPNDAKLSDEVNTNKQGVCLLHAESRVYLDKQKTALKEIEDLCNAEMLNNKNISNLIDVINADIQDCEKALNDALVNISLITPNCLIDWLDPVLNIQDVNIKILNIIIPSISDLIKLVKGESK